MNLDALQLEAERRPNDPVIWLRLGAGLVRRSRTNNDVGDRMAAIAALMHASSIADQPEVLGNVAIALTDVGAVDVAFQTMLRCEGSIANSAPYEKVIRALLEHDRAAEATELLGQLGPQLQSDANLRLLATQVFAATGHVERALEELNAMIAERPDLLPVHVMKAQLLAKQGRAGVCIAAWMDAVEIAPEDPAVLTGLGVALAAARRFDEAIERLEAVVRLDRSSVDAYLNLAVVLREAQELERAEMTARRAVDLAPQSAQAHYDLGLIYEAASRFDEAAQSFRDAIARRSNFERAAKALDRLRAREAQSAFTGRLGAFSMWQVLEILQNNRSTGRLEVTVKNAQAVIFVRSGHLVRIASELVPRLADVLETRCSIELPVSVPVQTRASDAQLHRQLAAHGFDPQTLQTATALQMQMALEQLVDASDGAFKFEQQPVDSRPLDVELDIRYVLLEIASARDLENK